MKELYTKKYLEFWKLHLKLAAIMKLNGKWSCDAILTLSTEIQTHEIMEVWGGLHNPMANWTELQCALISIY